ncbi:MAG: hypothetical protein HKL84_07745 [Acidimicrobiaceae bacterium]|nr:hypothetical protein [Acidimicrobiaceae bacterium]
MASIAEDDKLILIALGATNMVNDQTNEHGEHSHRKIFIHIDSKEYEAPKAEMTGQELRNLAHPPIGNQYNLWLETPGPGDDKLVEDAEIIRLHDVMCFYSALKQINPGATDAIA